MREHAVAVLNVAGSRESQASGIGRRVLGIVKAAMKDERIRTTGQGR